MKPSRLAIDAWANSPVKSLCREHQSDRNQHPYNFQTYVTHDTTNSVGRKNIQGIIISERELELGRKIADGTSHEAEKDGGGCAEETNSHHERYVVRYLVITYESQRTRMQG